MDVVRSLYESHYFSTLHFVFIVLHVTAALISLVVAPVAMRVSKGGQAHRRWGQVYFWGMVLVNVSAFVLLFWRFNPFLFSITVLTLYYVITGYRALQHKRNQSGEKPGWFDWTLSSVTLLAGSQLIIWGISQLGVATGAIPSSGTVSFVAWLLPLIFGIGIIQSAVADLRRYRTPPTNHNWWWYYHMDRMVSSYIGLLTALMVQQVGPGLPDSYAWIVWIAPTLIGSPLLARWIDSYRNRFEGKRRPVAAAADQLSAS
jgi:uncharacterized membrane protein